MQRLSQATAPAVCGLRPKAGLRQQPRRHRCIDAGQLSLLLKNTCVIHARVSSRGQIWHSTQSPLPQNPSLAISV